MESLLGRLTISTLIFFFILFFSVSCVSDNEEGNLTAMNISLKDEQINWNSWLEQNQKGNPFEPFYQEKDSVYFLKIEKKINSISTSQDLSILLIERNVNNGILRISFLIKGENDWKAYEWKYPDQEGILTSYGILDIDIEREGLDLNSDYNIYIQNPHLLDGSSIYLFFYYNDNIKRIASYVIPSKKEIPQIISDCFKVF